MRRERRRLRRELDAANGEAAGLRTELLFTKEQLGVALHTLSRMRYDQPAVFDANRPISFEGFAPPKTPHIHLQLLAKREVIQGGMMRAAGPDRLRAWVEGRTAQELARAMINEGLVAIDQAKVPMRPGNFDYEFDWAVYVGRPVPVRHHQPT
jgi:hypothetical protein